MRALVAVAMVVTPMPALAITSLADSQAADPPRERKICTRLQASSASRMGATRRVCRTAREWREAYGPDWRQELAGTPSIDDQEDSLDARTRVYSTLPTSGMGPR